MGSTVNLFFSAFINNVDSDSNYDGKHMDAFAVRPFTAVLCGVDRYIALVDVDVDVAATVPSKPILATLVMQSLEMGPSLGAPCYHRHMIFQTLSQRRRPALIPSTSVCTLMTHWPMRPFKLCYVV